MKVPNTRIHNAFDENSQHQNLNSSSDVVQEHDTRGIADTRDHVDTSAIRTQLGKPEATQHSHDDRCKFVTDQTIICSIQLIDVIAKCVVKEGLPKSYWR